MLETFLTFTLFGSGIAFGIMLLLLFISLILTELNESGEWAATFIGIAIVLNYFWGSFPILTLLNVKYILMYLFIGLIFSFIRTYFKGKELTLEQKKYFDLKNHVFRWWFLFPISAINWIFGRILIDVYNFIYSKIGKMYDKIFNM